MPKFVIVDDCLVIHGDYCTVVCDELDAIEGQAVVYRFLRPHGLDWQAEEFENRVSSFIFQSQQENKVKASTVIYILERLKQYYMAREQVERGWAS